MGLEWVIIFGLGFFVGTVGVRGRFEARALTDLTWLIVGWLGCLGAGCCWDCGGLRGLGCALAWGYESVRSHGQDGVGGPCGADRALLPEGGAQHRAHWLGP